MSTAGRTFRVFVSSTFADLKAERNALQEHVFPKLQKLCEANGCRFQAVDLRWGVSEEAALDQQTMNICLTELKRCQDVSPRPNFIILLGDRYGWMPLPPQIEASEFDAILSQLDDQGDLLEWYRLDTNAVPPEYVLRPRWQEVPEESDYDSWNKMEKRLRAILLAAIDSLEWPADDERRIKYECSATHQEIIEGALKLHDEREHVFAFLRSIQNLADLPPGSDYSDDGVEQARALKEKIRQTKGVTSFDYDVAWSGTELDSRIEQFTAEALVSLTRIVEEEFRQLKEIDDLTREDIAHQEFGAERCRHFVGRQKILDDIAAYVRGSQSSPLVVYGQSGSGKSALMAKAVTNAAEENKQAYIIQRFIGATPESTDIRTLLENLCREITRACNSDAATIPTEYKDLKEELPKRLELATPEKPLILFLDALDQLSATDNAHALNWLPSALPANVRVVVSVLTREDDAGQCLRSARSKVSESALLRLTDMTPDEGSEALGAWRREAKRALTEEQMVSVLAGFSKCPMPLYLKLAFEEARLWRSYDGLPCGADDVPGLSCDVPGVVGDMLARLRDKRQHGEVLVKTFLGLLSAARHGLSETETLELLSEDKEVMADLRARSARSPEASGIPAVVWLRFYHDLAPYLMERSADGTTLYNFYHRQVDETVKATYLRPEYHAQLAGYFGDDKRPLWFDEGESRRPNHRRCAELPFQQTESEMWDGLVETLTDLDFVDAKSKAGMVYDLVADYNRAERACLGGGETEWRGRMSEYATALILHAKSPDQNPLPNPPLSARYEPLQPASDRRGGWTPLETMESWRFFVANHTAGLSQDNEPAYQIAHNSAISGPVAEAVEKLDPPHSPWFILKNPPPLRLHPQRLRALAGHTEAVNAVSITPDGRRAVSGSDDKTLRVWDMETGESRVLEGHVGSVVSLSITPDGREAVSASDDRTLRVWDLNTGACIREAAYSARAVSITSDGRCVFFVDDHDTLCVWDLETDACRKVLEGHSWPCTVPVTPDGRRAISKYGERFWPGNTLSVWDLDTGKLLHDLHGHSDGTMINDISITPDGKYAVSASEDKTIRAWDLETGKCVRVREGHEVGTGVVSITADGKCAVFGNRNCYALGVWDIGTDTIRFLDDGLVNWVSAVSITPDGRRAISACDSGDNFTGSKDRTVRLWDLTASDSCYLDTHRSSVGVVCITPDGQRALSGSGDWRDRDNTLRVWDMKTGECLQALEGHKHWIRLASITPDGERAVSVGGYDEEATIRYWDLETGECLKTLEGHTNRVSAVSITPDSRRAVSGSGDNTLRVWDLDTGEARELKGHLGPVTTVSITPDGSRAVSGSSDDTLRVWDLGTGLCLRSLEEHASGVKAVSITPDGRWAVSGSEDHTVRVWDLETGQCPEALEDHRFEVNAVFVTPEGWWAVLASGDKTFRVWDFRNGESRDFRGHTSGVSAMSIAPDGRRAVSASGDKTLRIWDLESGASTVLDGHTEYVSAVSITPDGCHAISSGGDHTLRAWDLDKAELLGSWDAGSNVKCIGAHGLHIVAGTETGQVHCLRLENVALLTPIITAVRPWLFDCQTWDAALTAQCYWCGKRFIVKDEWIGQEIACPLDGCGKPLKLNPFVCDNSDWLR